MKSNHTLDELIEILECVADKTHDGHFTIFKFTTGYKIMFGTPDVENDRQRISLIANMPTLDQAIRKALQ